MSDESTYQPRVPLRASLRHIRGVDYHVNEWGDTGQPLIVYLHGWGDAGSTLQFVVDALSRDWHVIAPDWRGFGRTNSRASSYWFPDYLADLDCLLAKYRFAARRWQCCVPQWRKLKRSLGHKESNWIGI